MAEHPAVAADHLVKVFRGKREVRALDGVSFSVAPATVLGLLGPNGAGKTTAVRILTTILPPDGGQGTVLGHDVVREADTVRHLIGLAGQYATVDEHLTGRENLRMVGKLSHMPKKEVLTRADGLLEQFGLTDAASRPLKTYSGGMRRRLDLAAALLGRPPVLFLDEPTTGLDPHSRQDLWEVIEDLVRDGTTVLLTTQYLEEADRLAHQIVVVDHGGVIAEGTPAELKAGLGTTVVTVTVGDPATAARAASLLESSVPRAPVLDGVSVAMTVEHGAAVATEVLRTLDQHHIEVLGLTLREPSLDDVFLRLTGRRTDSGPPATDGRDGPTANGTAGDGTAGDGTAGDGTAGDGTAGDGPSTDGMAGDGRGGTGSRDGDRTGAGVPRPVPARDGGPRHARTDEPALSVNGGGDGGGDGGDGDGDGPVSARAGGPRHARASQEDGG